MNYNPNSPNLPQRPRISQQYTSYYDNLVYIGTSSNPSIASKYNNNQPFIAFILHSFFLANNTTIDKLPSQEITSGHNTSSTTIHVFLPKDSPLLSIIAPPLPKPLYDLNKLPKPPAIQGLQEFFNLFHPNNTPVFIGSQNFNRLFHTFKKFTDLPESIYSIDENNEIVLSFDAYAISIFNLINLPNSTSTLPRNYQTIPRIIKQSTPPDEDILLFLNPYDPLLSTIAPIHNPINPSLIKSTATIQENISSLTHTLITNLSSQNLDNLTKYNILNNITQQLKSIQISLNISPPTPNDDIVL